MSSVLSILVTVGLASSPKAHQLINASSSLDSFQLKKIELYIAIGRALVFIELFSLSKNVVYI